MIKVNQYPKGTVIETSKTEDFADFVTGEIESQWEDMADHETAKRVTGKEYPEAGEVMQNNFWVKYGDDEIPSYFLGHYARLPDGSEEPEPVDPIPEPTNQPVAKFIVSHTVAEVGTVITFDASESENAVSYSWDDAIGELGEWPLGEGQAIEFSFESVGLKYPRLTVTNQDGLTDSAMILIEIVESSVANPEEPEPMPDITKQQLYGLLTRVENLLTTEDPRSAFSTAESMMQDRDDLLARSAKLREIIAESD